MDERAVRVVVTVSTSLASLSWGIVSVMLVDRECSANERLTSWTRAPIVSSLDKKSGVSAKLLALLGILPESLNVAGERKKDIITGREHRSACFPSYTSDTPLHNHSGLDFRLPIRITRSGFAGMSFEMYKLLDVLRQHRSKRKHASSIL